MKKTIVLYLSTILAIACLALLMNLPWSGPFSHITFPQSLHIGIEGTNSILIFLIFLSCNHLYSQTKDERLLIMAGGFLVGSILNCVHIFTVPSFPYDFMSLESIKKNFTLILLLFGNLILPFSIYFALLHRPSQPEIKNFRFKVYATYFLIFLALVILPFFIQYFLPEFLTHKIQIILLGLEFISYPLYLMLAFILINIRQGANQTFFPIFTSGLIILGLGGLFYINPLLIKGNEILAHILQAIGLMFLFAGIGRLQTLAVFLRFKDELVAYLCLLLVSFYVIFISIASAIFNVIFPPFSAYLFVEFLLIFQFIIYFMANKLTGPITNITSALGDYHPGEGLINLPVMRRDEIGILTEKINATAMLSLQKILEVSQIAERERSIRRIFETMRRVSNQNIIKNTIIEEISAAFNPDICFIVLYEQANDCFAFDRYSEHLPSNTLRNLKIIDDYDLKFKQFNDLFKNNIEICFSNIEDYIETNALKGTTKEALLREQNIKSCCNLPINYANQLLGYVVLQYTNNYREWTKDDLLFLKSMATQIGIAINQAESNKMAQMKAAREDGSRNIIQSLRSTLNKTFIKHLLVKNVGKFFNADRVFFSDYDSQKNMYLPVEVQFEYLSGPKEKSFVNFDFSNRLISEYIHPLLEKRELIIFNLDEYIHKNQRTRGLFSRFENVDVKSSYNFPVFYEQKIIGYLCIEYTHEVNVLPKEDISRIRDICHQAAVALYQASLYTKLKQSNLLDAEVIENMTNEFQVSLARIFEISEKLSEPKVEPAKRTEYLSTISECSETLLKLAADIIDKFEIEYTNIELYCEEINSEQLIMDVVNFINSSATNKNINLNTNLANANINGDWKIITNILYILLINTIKFTQQDGLVRVASKLNDGKLIISIDTSTLAIDTTKLNAVLERVEPITRSYLKKLKGMELGLAKVKKLIELHDGSVHLELTQEQSTRILLELPNAHETSL